MAPARRECCCQQGKARNNSVDAMAANLCVRRESDVDLSVTPNEPVEPSYCVRKLGKRLEKKHVYTYDQMQRVRFAKVYTGPGL